jgi:hypothetical protein
MPAADSLAQGCLPLGLAHGWKVVKPVAAGQPLRWSDVAVDADADGGARAPRNGGAVQGARASCRLRTPRFLTKFSFRIRTRSGTPVENLMVQAADRARPSAASSRCIPTATSWNAAS